MEINEIKRDFKNELLNRRELKVSINSEGNPGLDNSIKLLSDHFKVDAEKIVMRSLKNNFGVSDFLIEAFVYDSKDLKEKFEKVGKKASKSQEKKA